MICSYLYLRVHFAEYFIHGPPYAASRDTPQATLRMKGPEDVSAVCWIQQPRSEIWSSQFVGSDLNIEQSWFQKISFFQVKSCNCKIQNSARAISMYQQIRVFGHQIAPKSILGLVWFKLLATTITSNDFGHNDVVSNHATPGYPVASFLPAIGVCFWEQITCLVTTWTGTEMVGGFSGASEAGLKCDHGKTSMNTSRWQKSLNKKW